MPRRVIHLEWNEDYARVWWKFGHDAPTAAPFPGVRRAWFAFLREWVLDTVDTVYRAVRDSGITERCPLPEFLQNATPLAPAAVDPPEARTMCGAASNHAPPARPRGVWPYAAMCT
jgi:hypothetical protein